MLIEVSDRVLFSAPLFIYYLSFHDLYMYVFIFSCATSSFLHTGFLWCGDRGYSLVAVHGLLPMMASLVGEHGF